MKKKVLMKMEIEWEMKINDSKEKRNKEDAWRIYEKKLTFSCFLFFSFSLDKIT